MSDMQPTFRRLSDKDAARFLPWHNAPTVKIFAAIILAAVLIRWITS